MKKLLILAGAGVHNKVVRTAKEMGIYTIVTDYLTDSPAKMLSDEKWMLNITDVDEIVKRCKEENVDGVMNFCIDPAQKPYLEICTKLGVPCIGTVESFSVLTDKRKFKDYCIAHNVDVIPEYNEEDIINDKVEYPVFIKPNVSRGSRGQSVCYNKEEALQALEVAKNESSDRCFICEKYMKGKQDIGSAFFVIDSEPYLVKFGDRYLGKEKDGLEKQVICTKLPSKFSSVFEAKVIERVKNMIRSLGIKYGPVFLQGFVDGDTVRYYDPAQRMPGGDYDLILKKASGFDTVRSWINFALTGNTKYKAGKPENAYMLNGGTALLFTISVRGGKMCKIIGMDKILEHPYVIYGRQIVEQGEIIPNSGDIKQRVAAFGAYIPDNKELKSFVDFVYSTYHVYDENDEDMIVSKFEYVE